MRDIVSEERLEAALTYLSDTDEAFAEAKAAVERTHILTKRARARCYLLTSGTVAERQAQTETAGDVTVADDAYCEAVKAFETLKAQRERADIVVGVWRSLEASRRKA